MRSMKPTIPFDPETWAYLGRHPSMFCKHFLRDQPHPGQVNWLDNSTEPINTLVPGNRWGKTYVIAMKHIVKNVFKVGLTPQPTEDDWMAAEYQTVSTAPSFDQAGLVYKAVRHLTATQAMAPLVKKWRATPFPSVEFWNGSVLHVRSLHDDARYVDGHGYRYLSVDEAGWIPNLRKLVDSILLFRLAGGGELDFIGTPKGKNDLYWYFKHGEKHEPGYFAQRGSIFDNPHLPYEDLQMRARLLEKSDMKTRAQVLYGEFVDFEGLAFTEEQVENSTDPRMSLHNMEIPEVYEYRLEDHRYITAWDLGRITDYTVGVTLDITRRPWRLVRFDRLNRVPWEQIYSLIGQVRREYDCRWATIDATGPGGDVVEEELLKRGIPTNGVKTQSKQAKLGLINGLQGAFDDGRMVLGEEEVLEHDGSLRRRPRLQSPGEGNWGLLRMPLIPQLRAELEMYMLDDKNLVQDSVFALALAIAEARGSEYLGKPAMGGIFWGGEAYG
jgi:hypothetical protein